MKNIYNIIILVNIQFCKSILFKTILFILKIDIIMAVILILALIK